MPAYTGSRSDDAGHQHIPCCTTSATNATEWAWHPEASGFSATGFRTSAAIPCPDYRLTYLLVLRQHRDP